jgi:hypothetical protein
VYSKGKDSLQGKCYLCDQCLLFELLDRIFQLHNLYMSQPLLQSSILSSNPKKLWNMFTIGIEVPNGHFLPAGQTVHLSVSDPSYDSVSEYVPSGHWIGNGLASGQ